MPGRWVDGCRLAVGTLTAVPIRPPGQIDRQVAEVAMLLAPVATLPLALVPLLAHLAVARIGMPPALAAALTVGVVAWLSRGLHLDGLADTADGFAASFDRQRALDVMRMGNVGPAGVSTVVLVALIQVTALAALVPTWRGAVLAMVAVVGSRHTLAWLCAPWFPSARPKGLGATVAGSVRGGAQVGVLIALTVAYAAAAVLVWPGAWRFGLAAFAVLGAGLAGALVVGLQARRRLGGITGDILGAGVEIGLAAGLVVAACL